MFSPACLTVELLEMEKIQMAQAKASLEGCGESRFKGVRCEHNFAPLPAVNR